jgi:hypothetical protein
VLKEISAFGGAECVDEIADALPKAFNGTLGMLSQMSFELGEGFLYRIEIVRAPDDAPRPPGRRVSATGSARTPAPLPILAA